MTSSNVQTRRYNRMISVGKYCQPAWQIRRFTGVQTPSYFDWTEAPHEGLVRILQHRFQGVFLKDRLSITPDEKSVRDLDTDILYHHHFSYGQTKTLLTPSMIETGYERQKAALGLMHRFWTHGIENYRTLFVRQDWCSREQAMELYSALQSQAGRFGCGLLVLCSPEFVLEIEHPHIHVEIGPPDPTTPDEWRGDDSAWNQILSKYWLSSNEAMPELSNSA